MNHVIVGAGPAGVVAAEALRKLQPEASVSLIGDEPEPPYSRMALPYYLIKQIEESGTHLRKGASHYADIGISVVQDRVTGVDRKAQKLSLANGSDVSYDKLLIATGSNPVSPRVAGTPMPPPR